MFLPRQILNVRHVGILILVHVTAAKIVTQVNFRWNLPAVKTSVHSITQTDRLYRKPRRLHFGSKKPTEAILSKFGLFGGFFFRVTWQRDGANNESAPSGQKRDNGMLPLCWRDYCESCRGSRSCLEHVSPHTHAHTRKKSSMLFAKNNTEQVILKMTLCGRQRTTAKVQSLTGRVMCLEIQVQFTLWPCS